MLDNKKIAAFISEKRKRLGMTQAEVAARLNVSFQAVSKWENGTLPNVEILVGLAGLLHTSVEKQREFFVQQSRGGYFLHRCTKTGNGGLSEHK